MRRMGERALRGCLVVLLTALGLVPAHAATIVCGGTVASLAYHSDGVVLLQLSSMNTVVQVCSVNTTWNVAGFSTSPAACKTMHASFLAARLSGTPVNDLYFDAPSVPASCAGFSYMGYVSVRFFTQ
jgi:hypothetical protein